MKARGGQSQLGTSKLSVFSWSPTTGSLLELFAVFYNFGLFLDADNDCEQYNGINHCQNKTVCCAAVHSNSGRVEM
jgi:hypothetical protein